jgi:hypothetical protein
MDLQFGLSRVETRILPYTTGLFARRSNRLPQLIGSACIVRIRDRDFMVTAAHVLRENKASNLFGGTRTLRPLEGGSIYRSDEVDIGVIPIEPVMHDALLDVHRLRPEDTDVDDIPEPGVLYTFTGYPSSRNKPNLHAKEISNQPTLFTGRSAPLGWYRRLDIAPETHVATRFRLQKARDLRTREHGAPAPQGMSGGPVWRIGRPTDIGAGLIAERVIGVGIEYRQETFIGIRIAFAFAIIASVAPELAQLLPRPRHGKINIRRND